MGLNFERGAYAKTLFRRDTCCRLIYMTMYVDDALLVASTEDAWKELLAEVTKRYTLTSVGNATLHLCLTIAYDRDTGVLSLGMIKYMEQIAKRFYVFINSKEFTPFKKPKTWLYPAAVTEETVVGSREQDA